MNDERAKRLVEKIGGYFALMAEESDRGAAIVGAALLDDLLEQLVKTKLEPAIEKDDELFDGTYAPCGTLSAKIDLAYRVGAVDRAMRSSLHLIRKMRNEAAHVSERRSLLSFELQNRLRELLRLQAPLLARIYDSSSITVGGEKFDCHPRRTNWKR